ncbi:hypothetical protein FACS1894191_5210 [Clostridia bacterium]|nr:hypothetical protein FACS1894191_5210 [Clostridia bacterium]
MLKKIFAYPQVRKALVFLGGFVLGIIGTCGMLASNTAEDISIGVMGMPELVQGPAGGQAEPAIHAEKAENTVWEPSARAYEDEDEASADSPEEPPAPEAGAETNSMVWNVAVDAGDFVYLPEIPLNEELQRYTYQQCIANGLDYALVLALMWRESGFELDAVGYNDNGTSDSGVMQINDINREWLKKDMGITDLMDPKQNITAGTAILGGFVKRHGMHNALLAYQYGEAGMAEKLKSGLVTNSKIQLLYSKREYFRTLMK